MAVGGDAISHYATSNNPAAPIPPPTHIVTTTRFASLCAPSSNTKAVAKLLKMQGLKVQEIDLWELDEAFASQAIYCRDVIGIVSSYL
jgi:hypothetical protein